MRNVITLAAFLLATGGAFAQSASVTTSPDGTVSSTVSVPGLPPQTATAGPGGTRITGASTYRCVGPNGRMVTVRSADGHSVSSAWASGNGSVAVSGSGSPGSKTRVTNCRAAVSANNRRTK